MGEGIRGFMREGGTGRREALVAALKSVGGSVGRSVESFYYAFGETDVLGVIEVPEPFDAAKKTPAYRAPGQ
ncbi:GYD domain-containing protein [Cryobacterium sp. TMT2-14]|uniref:GYD domain-containing protein n=1 Tax=Cryobacterium sp. TMT2-14 TaxID=1259245 RepID=UPI001F53E44D|nr:GYD domain-containing protein [Cryobacterium sp. TMT2-14]